ncbi:tellurium resistance cAMP binding protein TerE [Klebsiella pneumoniae]|uniref:tellurium resistance cAMP binding protein TerE n=1 Tax=Klebsiella pneumoniae TaxID=573 RepID=UPI001034D868|nr:tellurium resistance cAMP binding protein TerE [Klebsiella pneumoniae]HEP0362022.1 tellurium resistance cAMP binding protein TerE [Klebsiella pneumoniae subsp. pneumoniae]MCB3531744.1 tellurium resistance cAMP binding protein TerE [Klebsiella pneumoniae]MCW9183848.1 tellurium resistance cAMP binding protein TerE [Klebsiella pneumoniae]NCA47761.1 chemical-damaging agent resistance protein C [Klebsiella pneumoniae]HBR5504044.1 tellurium resistance cAMP binding protein TerE [Klebsiella pneumon
MAVSLVKGGNVSLTKEAPSMNVALVGLGWDARVTDGQAFDLDASVFLVGENGKVLSDSHFVFYNNTTSPDGAVQHQGDNRTGEGDGDDEQVKIDLTKVAADVKKLVFAVTIHEADSRKQNFGMVSNSYIRVVNNDNGSEIARFDLSEDASTETAMIFGELYRHGAEWKFKAVGQGFAGGLAALATQHGINI